MARKLKDETDHRNLIKRGQTWYTKYMTGGKLLVQSTGETDLCKARAKRDTLLEKVNVSDERDRVANIQRALSTIDDHMQAIKDRAPAMTLLQAWGAFKSAPKGKTPRGRVIMPGDRTLADYEGRWGAFCDWMEKNYPQADAEGNKIPWELRQVGREHAERYIAEIGAGRSANTRNKSLTFLRLVFKTLAEEARIKENPFEGMDAAPLAVSRKRPLTLAELGAISKNLLGKGEMELLFALGYYTGARLGDCVLMRWDSLDMGARRIRYTPHKTAKGNVEITLTVSPALFALLDAVPVADRRGLVLPELGKLYQKDPSAVSKRVQQVFEDAKIETDLEVKGYSRKVARVGFHSLRHSHITALLEGGVPMDMVRQQAGHSTIGMTAHYYHATEKTLQAASDALPEIGQPLTADASSASLGALLAMLDGLTHEQLHKLVARAQELIRK